MSTQRLFTLALLLALTLPLATPAVAQVSWAIAERPDDKIEALVSRLEPYLEPLPGRAEAPGAVLYHQILIAPDDAESRRCENMILTVQDPAGMPVELMQPRQPGPVEVVSMSAFVRRGSEYRRLTEEQIVHVVGPEDIGRSRFEIDWGELKDGDVIGWSLVIEQESPFRFVPIRLGQSIPIVLAALQVQSNGDLAYEIRTNGVSQKDVKQKKEEVTDGRAMSIKASINQRPAVDAVPDETPWPADYPYMGLYLKEVRIDSQNQFLLPGWARTGGWNQSVMAIGGAAQAMADDLEGVDIALSTITTGKTTNTARAEAVFSWVRDKFTLLEGPDYDSGGVRDLNDVIKAKEATPTEKALLMGALLAKLEIPATAAAVRTPDLGKVDRDWKNLSQFDELVMRTVEDGTVRYWAPQCSSCEPGQTPESWAGAEVLTYEFASIEAAEKYQEDLRQKAMVEGQFDLAEIQDDMEAQSWAFFETIGD
jgi:transglutaminase-like putative cysteine protease